MTDNPKPGRPSSYDPKYCQEILEYFGVQPYREIIKKIHTKQGDVIEIPEDVANDVPTFAGFAAKIGIHRETLLNWTKEHEEFFDAYKKAKELQENFIVVNGNRGLINTAFGIFTAKNVLGWRDKQPGEVDVVVNNNAPKSDQELDARIEELMKKTGQRK